MKRPAHVTEILQEGRDAGGWPVYGCPEWDALDPRDPRWLAAIVHAAECWRTDADNLSDRLQVRLDAWREEDQRIGAEQAEACRRTVAWLATTPSTEQRVRDGYIPRRYDLPPALPRDMWTAEECALEAPQAARLRSEAA